MSKVEIKAALERGWTIEDDTQPGVYWNGHRCNDFRSHNALMSEDQSSDLIELSTVASPAYKSLTRCHNDNLTSERSRIDAKSYKRQSTVVFGKRPREACLLDEDEIKSGSSFPKIKRQKRVMSHESSTKREMGAQLHTRSKDQDKNSLTKSKVRSILFQTVTLRDN